ncbi:MAG TPA: hypothetical protein VHO24_17335 [Opitutaceae bacterium]|nr:hypothetical protein [Opitutaceae bacterium]
MTFPSRKRRSAGWPFWVLIAAWFCANTPQVAVYEFVSWLGSARHFSHQQRLQNDVVSVLTGDDASQLFMEGSEAPATPFLPVVPTDAVLKKIELAVHHTSELLPPPVRALARAESESLVIGALRDRPPLEPPRARLVVSC